MKLYSLGVVTLTGTAINLSTLLTGATEFLAADIRAAKICIQPLVGNSAVSYAGLVGFNKSTGVGVLRQLNVQPSTGKMDIGCLCSQDLNNALYIRDFAVDGTSGDMVLVTYAIS